MKPRKVVCSCVWVFLILQITLTNGVLDPKLKKKEESKMAKLPPCAACKNLVQSFEKGIEKTARGKHEGGDAAWEESRLSSYSRSEVRLVEIQELLCKDVPRGEDQCHQLAGEYEHLLEEWWFKHQDEAPKLHPWLCIQQLEACCPDHHYGPNCDACPGGVPPCNNNGKCKGDGTRKGSGACSCDTGYTGALCTDCDVGFFEAYRDENKLLCERCHQACQGPCTHAGPKGCAACKPGWLMDTEGGCIDTNECMKNKGRGPCKLNQFCVNNIGSFTCINCDKSCKSCDGDGPDMCDACAEGYRKTQEQGTTMCIDEDEYEERLEKQKEAAEKEEKPESDVEKDSESDRDKVESDTDVETTDDESDNAKTEL